MRTLVIVTSLLVLMISSDVIASGFWLLYDINSDWINTAVSTAGNVAGGIIGGFVALFVAQYQISNERIKEETKEKSDFKTLVLMYIDDLEHAKTTIESMIRSRNIDPELIIHHVISLTWTTLRPMAVRHMNRDLQLKCHRLDKRINIVQLLSSTDELDIATLEKLSNQIDETITDLKDYLN